MILDSGQVVLTTPKFTLSQSPEHDASVFFVHPTRTRHINILERCRLLHNTLLYPSYVTAVSMLLFLGQAIATAWYNRGQSSEATGGFSNRVRKQICDHGGSVIFAFKLSRLVACFALAGLSLASLGEVVPVPGFRLDIFNPAFVQVTLCATFVRRYFSFRKSTELHVMLLGLCLFTGCIDSRDSKAMELSRYEAPGRCSVSCLGRICLS